MQPGLRRSLLSPLYAYRDAAVRWLRILQLNNKFKVSKASLIATAIFFTVIILFLSGERLDHAETTAHVPVIGSSTAALKNGHPLGKIIKGKKAAFIIETRPVDSLVPLILHFSAVLGPEWPIIIFTQPPIPPVFQSAAMLRLISAGQLAIVFIPPTVEFRISVDVSTFLTSPWIWDQLAPADHVFMFQSDSIICGNSERRVDDYIEYDFVGAPMARIWGEGYNGGFSLRNRNTMLAVIEKMDFVADMLKAEAQLKEDAKSPSGLPTTVLLNNEDQWYYAAMKKLPPKRDGSPAANFPSEEVASTFAVESIWADNPLGYHQVSRWQKERITEVHKWCPEWKLITEGWFADSEVKEFSNDTAAILDNLLTKTES